MIIDTSNTTHGSISYATAGGATILGLGVNEWLALAGIASIVGTFAVNLYYRRRQDRREQILFERESREQ